MKRIIGLIIGVAIATAGYADAVLNGTGIGGYGWKGMSFTQPQLVTIVGWKTNNANTVMLGIFEGANRADFMDAIPLYIISESTQTNSFNYARIECTRGFRYLRYVAPSGQQNNLPEIQLYGEQGAGNDAHLPQLTNLPTVAIHTLNEQLPYDKEHEIDCYITIISDEGKTVLADTAGIRERGNASREFPKKPYRIKFAHKHHVLGAPANAKKWTLINNYGDKTLMRNQLAFELSRRLAMPYTPFCAYVDVVLNGDYKGCYQLCDQIEVRKNRVAITEMTANDNSGSELTGGYLVEADAYAADETSWFYSNRGTPVTIKYPKADSITPQQASYIRQQYNNMEGYWQRTLDLNTFLRHFLVGEMSGNTDTYWSTYFYKQRDNDTLYVGPVWDFDLAFDNDGRTYHVNDRSDYIYRSGGSTTGYLQRLVDKIVVENDDAKKQLAAIYDYARRHGLTEEDMLQYIDQQAEMLDQSQKLNFIRWPIMNRYVHQNPRIHGSYNNEVENVRNFITKRIQWMDNKLGFDPRTLDLEEVQNTNDNPQCTKVLRNGRIIIIRDGKEYNILGKPEK